MSGGVYVLAVLGESPAILSELLWWLVVRERHPLAGIEAWATDRGADRLARLVESDAWQDLVRQTNPLPDLTEGDPEAGFGFRVHRMRSEQGPMNDVRSEVEARAVSATLHDRVRQLRSELADRIPIVGSLAGGRKTVSAALHTAFCLQAGPSDRLVHVLLEPTLEYELRRSDQLRRYACPTPEWEARFGIPMPEQLDVYDVPFPRVRYLVPRRLSDALERLPWSEVWPVLDANMGLEVRALLVRRGYQSWTYRIEDAATERPVFEIKLGRRQGAVLAAMASAGPTAADLLAWLDARNVGWRPSKGRGDSEDIRTRAVRNAVSSLRAKLRTEIPVGLEGYAPADEGFEVGPIEVREELP